MIINWQQTIIWTIILGLIYLGVKDKPNNPITKGIAKATEWAKKGWEWLWK